ncbi:MAG: N-acetyltransferase [Clostridiaceae bacterium]|nr:N-acetyltransferase [Clostridiaceae bacterium]
MIRKATINDLHTIMAIIKETIIEMHSYNNNQWDENYPQEKDFKNDIESQQLYVSVKDGQVVGLACINMDEPIEYQGLNWQENSESMVIHRMAVDIHLRRKGIGMELMNFADKLALENHIPHLKTDTFSLNTKMQCLFKKCGYNFVGEMNFKGKALPFYSYEKILK